MNFDKLNWTVILSVAVAVEMQIGNGSMSLAHMFPDAWIPYIKAWSANLGTIGATWMAVRAYGTKIVPHDSIAIDRASTMLDPDAKAEIGSVVAVPKGNFGGENAAVKVVGALLFALMLPMFFSHAHAQVQFPKPRSPQQVADDIKTALAPKQSTGLNISSFQSGLSAFNDGVQKITKEIVDLAISDVQAALDDATKKNDEISAPCWQAHLNLFKNLPVEWDTPPKMPIGIALGIQIQRDILNSINGTTKGTLKVDCAALYGDELRTLAGVGALLGIRIATGGAA